MPPGTDVVEMHMYEAHCSGAVSSVTGEPIDDLDGDEAAWTWCPSRVSLTYEGPLTSAMIVSVAAGWTIEHPDSLWRTVLDIDPDRLILWCPAHSEERVAG